MKCHTISYAIINMYSLSTTAKASEYKGLKHQTMLYTLSAGHSGRAVQGMKYLRSLERWDRVFESHSR
jgi:hypothetical protein